MKTIKLKKDKTLSEKAIVIKILQSKGVGDVIKIKNHIRHQHHIKFDRTYCDKGAMEVYVFGAERKDVQQAVEGFEICGPDNHPQSKTIWLSGPQISNPSSALQPLDIDLLRPPDRLRRRPDMQSMLGSS